LKQPPEIGEQDFVGSRALLGWVLIDFCSAPLEVEGYCPDDELVR